MTATAYDPVAFHAGLVEHGLIIPSGVQGVFGRGPTFERVLERFDALVMDLASEDGARPMMFPPVIARKVLEKSDYMDSFPHLAGTVFSYSGDEHGAREISRRIHCCEPWDELQDMTDVVLAPAACYPVYPTFAGTVPAEGHLVSVVNWVFRHEPSIEPTRMQSFRIREFVRCGTPEQAVEWRDMWLQRGLELLAMLGLPAQSDVASDPFFGKGGRMLAANQKSQKLKFEILVPVISTEKPTAICSFNFHEDHFGLAFGIHTADGAVANTACLGFGLERVVMALLQTHGFDPDTWPQQVRAKLWD